jgi:hypothetical protein
MAKFPAKTYERAQADIIAAFKAAGWVVVANLKIPHATHPGGNLRLWFKARSIYYSVNGSVKDIGSAHSLFVLDLRTADPVAFVAEILADMPRLLTH